MNSKQSMWKLLCGVAGVAGMGLLITNCTIKTSSDDGSGGTGNSSNSSAGAGNTTSGACSPVGSVLNGCICAGNLTSHQVCESNGTYGACVCAVSSEGGASSGGASNTAGHGGSTATGGAPAADAGAGGEGPLTYATCEDCLADKCKKQFDACNADSTCISDNVDGSGQYERIAKCINEQRVNGVVKRDVVRGCGVTIGQNADPDVISAWAPEGMDPVTTDLLNCMADDPKDVPASWANADANYPVDGNDMVNPTPWPNGTCAKVACASAK